MSRNTKYLAYLGAVVAALALGCAEPTAPHSDTPCSGGGTQGWDICGTQPTDSVKTTTVSSPTITATSPATQP